MKKYTPTELKAIGYFAERNNCIPQLSTRPTMYFKKRETGELITKELQHLVSQYKNRKKEENNVRSSSV